MNPEEILESGDVRAISRISYLYYINKDYETIKKVITICFGKEYSENDRKFLNSAIYGDIPCVFEILDKLNYEYERDQYVMNASLYKSTKCIAYFETGKI
jgi:hypothetical protein